MSNYTNVLQKILTIIPQTQILVVNGDNLIKFVNIISLYFNLITVIVGIHLKKCWDWKHFYCSPNILLLNTSISEKMRRTQKKPFPALEMTAENFVWKGTRGETTLSWSQRRSCTWRTFSVRWQNNSTKWQELCWNSLPSLLGWLIDILV